jgi:hypothetical protein
MLGAYVPARSKGHLLRRYKREPNPRISIVSDLEHIHLFVAAGEAGRFSAFIPGCGHRSSPVLRSIGTAAGRPAPVCAEDTCYL